MSVVDYRKFSRDPVHSTTDTHHLTGTYFSERNTTEMQPYSTNSVMLVEQMVGQMQYIVKDNRELKGCIKSNNQDFHKKLIELQTWKENNEKEAEKLKENYERVRKVIRNLREENAVLKAENLNLENKINKQIENSEENETRCSKEENQHASPKMFHEEYSVTVENLVQQLKETLSSRDKLEESNERLQVSNAQLQKRSQSDQTRLGLMAKLQEEKQDLEKYKESLLKEIQVHQERFKISEKSNKELKSQLVVLVNEGKTYQSEAKQYQSKIETFDIERKRLKEQLVLAQERFKISVKDFEKQQKRKEIEISDLHKKLDERSRSIDALFEDYNKIRLEKNQLCAERAQTDNMLARLLASEESIKKKDRELKEYEERFKNDLRQKTDAHRQLEEDVASYQAQAAVFEQDFQIERADRIKLHGQVEALKNELEQRNRRDAHFD